MLDLRTCEDALLRAKETYQLETWSEPVEESGILLAEETGTWKDLVFSIFTNSSFQLLTDETEIFVFLFKIFNFNHAVYLRLYLGDLEGRGDLVLRLYSLGDLVGE